MSPLAPDFEDLLAAGSRPGCVVRIVRADDLRLPSGRLVAAEPPGNFPDGALRYALAPAVPPGDYPVEIVLADYGSFTEVAAARVVVRREPVRTWRLALPDGQDDSALGPDEVLGYAVDGGSGAFGSPEVFDALADEEAREDLIADQSFGRDEPFQIYEDEATGTNLVMFASGGGDGRYPTWVGYTDGGEVACFLTDFGTLTQFGP
jgi:Protein of unknown function (DUF4241)